MIAQERVFKTINHEEPDRIPSVEGPIQNASILNYYNIKYREEVRGLEDTIQRSLDICSAVGLDIAPSASLVLYVHKPIENGFIDEFGRRMEYVKNPVDDMIIAYYMGGVIKDFDDYEAFPKPDPDNPLRERWFKIAKELGKQYKGKLYVVPVIAGIMELTWEGFGFQNFSRLLTKKSQIKQVFDDRGKFGVEMMKRIVDWGEETGPVIILDDYGYKTGIFMSPENYRTYIFPWLKSMCKIAHKAGIKVCLHSCGDLYPIFEDIIDCGVDALNPIEPTTAEPEYDIFKLNEKYGDKITFVGNVSPQDLADKDPEFIRNYTKKLIKELGPGGGFILASGHSINPAIKLENFLAMRETLERYGKYPISIK